ncbi:MAG: molybdopterin-dependent oxidoreductase [Syntrophobacteraceae bacterium]
MKSQPVQNSMKPGKWVPSTCKMCLHSCNVLVHVTDSGIVNKVEGNPTSVSNKGRLCPKGNCALMRLYDPQRVKTPLKRTNPKKGPKENPRWVPISWDEAFEIVSRELKKTLEEDPRKLLPAINDFQKLYLWAWPAAFGNNANYFTVVGTYCGGGYHPMNGMIHSSFAAANDVDYCNYWMNVGGGDGFSSHLHVASAVNYMANARVERGMHVVIVEPRLSIGAAKAEEWVPIKPATDRQFALGLCHVLVREKLYDVEFLKKDTNAVYLVGPEGYFVRSKEGNKCMVWDPVDNRAKEWDDSSIKDFALEGNYKVNGVMARPAFQVFKDILKDCAPQKISEITTVPVETIERIAREFSRAAQIGATIKIDGRSLPYRPAAFNYYRGAQGHKYGSMANHSYKLVNMLLGNIDTPGGHIGCTLDDQMVDKGHVAPGEDGMLKPMPHQLHPEIPFAYPPNTTHLQDYFPLGVDPGHLNNVTLFDPQRFGFDFYPDTMLICHSNPLWNMNGDQERYFEIMRKMRFIVAIDIVLNESTVWADVVLPADDTLESWNMTMIEPTNTEGMCLRQPVIPRLYDTKSEEEIFNEISERIGILDTWNMIQNYACGFHQKPELLLEPGKKYSDRDIAEKKGLLWNDKPIEWYMEHGHAVTKRRPDKWYRPWEGMRLHFYLEYILQQRDQLKHKMEEAKVPFRNEWSWEDYQPLPDARLDPVHTEPSEYDMYAITFKDIQINFTENLSIPWISDIVYKDPVHMGILINPKTAAQKGIKTGDVIRITSAYGKLTGLAKVTEGVHPQTVAVSNALTRWVDYHAVIKPGGGNFNRILPADLRNTDACSGQMETVAKVKVTKLRSRPAEYTEEFIKSQFYAD